MTWEEADPFFILTVWLPLSTAAPENGCLQIIPRTHGTGLMNHHIKAGFGTVIVDEEMPDVEPLTLPMEKGDLLLMHKEIPHRSTTNHSETVRWSMDLRYQKTGEPSPRPEWPSLVACSRHDPGQETTYETWRDAWAAAVEETPQQIRYPRPVEPLSFGGEMYYA